LVCAEKIDVLPNSCVLLESFYHVPRTDAAGANLDALNGTVPHRFYLLQVGIPGPACFIVGVAHVIAEAGAFPADFADFGHDDFPPCIVKHWYIANQVVHCK
jgi:hypothetical protein